MKEGRFVQEGIQAHENSVPIQKTKWYQGKPLISLLLLGGIILGCLCCEAFIPGDPTYMDLPHNDRAPCAEFWFGTDTMGRDIFSMIWYGGRISLFIGLGATCISTGMGILAGTVSGLAPGWLDGLLMRLTEILLSVPRLLFVFLIQAILGKANVLSICFVLGITGWMELAKVIRTEVRQLKDSEYIAASKCMGGGFCYILWKHLTPNFISSIMFMVVMNIRSAMMAEATLSFLGIGLPLEILSWGSMLSLAEGAVLGGAWWMLLIPGIFLVTTLMCITEIGNSLRRDKNRRAGIL